eukprot:m.71403 g.71403  ORF g.71403 m.71403 type:complete len:500 (+) comp24347_c0_seq1:76-1575(+)
MPPKKKLGKKVTQAQALAASEACVGASVDIDKTTYTIGKCLANGAYGTVHLVGKDIKCTDKTPYVAKIELMQHSSCKNEVLTYKKALLQDASVAKHGVDWQKRMKFDRIGLGSLIVTRDNIQIGLNFFRVIIIRRLGPSLASVLGVSEFQSETFGPDVTLRTGHQMLDSLEFLHSRGTAHGDVKLANICCGSYKDSGALANKDELFLIDFGIAQSFSIKPMEIETSHVKYDVTMQPPHQGTLVFCSVDSHNGVMLSRRSDLHVLGYVMLSLLGTLPWLSLIKGCNPTTFTTIAARIAAMKCAYFQGKGEAGMSTTTAKTAAKKLVQDSCDGSYPGAESALEQYFHSVFSLSYSELPNYSKLRQMLAKGFRKGKFSFDTAKEPKASQPKGKQKQKQKRQLVETINSESDGSDIDFDIEIVEVKKRKKTIAPAKKKAPASKPTRTKKATQKSKVLEVDDDDVEHDNADANAVANAVANDRVFESDYARRLYERAQKFKNRA